MKELASRVRRALKLEAELFEEVEHDHGAGGQALAVVIASSACGGVGNMAAASLLDLRDAHPLSMLVLSAAFVVAWLTLSFVTMAVGTAFFGGRADMGEMQRALGFAAAPGLVMLLPGVGMILSIPWSLAAMVIAVRQACDFSTRKALLTVATAFGILLALGVPPLLLVLARS